MLGWRRAGPPLVGGGPSGPRRGQVQFQSGRPRVHAMPSAGLPAGAVNPSGLDPRPPPRRRGPRQGRRAAECEWSGAPPAGFSLDGVASGGRVVEMPGGDRTPRRGCDKQRCRGRHNAVICLPLMRLGHDLHEGPSTGRGVIELAYRSIGRNVVARAQRQREDDLFLLRLRLIVSQRERSGGKGWLP